MDKKISYALFALLALIFLGLKINSLNYAISDENTYYLMGSAVAQGQMMYRDFFFSHPPVQILLFAALIKIFGFNFFILKATATISAVITALFLFLTVREKIGEEESLIAAALFLFTYDTLRFTSYPTGAELTVMFLAISFYFLMNNKYLAAGLLSAVAALTGLYALIAIAGFMLYLAWQNRSGFSRFFGSFCALFIIANAAFVIIAPMYVTQVYLYHLQKPDEGINKMQLIGHIILANILLWTAALAFFAGERRLRKEIFISLCIVIFFWAFFILAKKVFAHYMLLAFPFAALIGAYSIMHIKGISRKGLLLIACALITVSIAVTAFNFLAYDYQDFREAPAVAAYIRENSNSPDTIFGDEEITPLLSLLSEREIAMRFYDSNSLRFTSGVTDVNETIRSLKGKVKFFITYELDAGNGKLTYGIANIPEFQKFIAEQCTEARTFRSAWRQYTKEYHIYDCAHA